MTEESLQVMKKKVSAAEDIVRQVGDLKKIIEKEKEAKMWGVCLYYDEECDDKLYVDLPVEDVQRFMEEFVLKGIARLEQELANL